MKVKIPNGIDSEGKFRFNEVELNQEAMKDFVIIEKKNFDVLMKQFKIAYEALRFLSIKSEFARNVLDELEISKEYIGKNNFERD